MSEIRDNGIVGVIEVDGLHSKISMHFSEWWNGEGIDFDFDDKKIALHLDEIEALVVAAHAAGYLDIEEVLLKSKELKESSDARKLQIQEIREKNS